MGTKASRQKERNGRRKKRKVRQLVTAGGDESGKKGRKVEGKER